MSGSSINQTFDDDILANASNLFVSTLVQEVITTTSRPDNPSTMSSTKDPMTTVQRLVHAVTTTYNFTDYMDTNGTWLVNVTGNGSSTTPGPFEDGLSNLDLIWIVPILILIILFLLGLAFLLFYCIKRTEICFLKYCRCCFRCCKCCTKSSYLLRDEHAKLTDDDTNVLYMRELRVGRGRP
ncbi:unnamed protein product [Acanthosepion pharaonis]|uniref:Uncharacterized protein n=1 Tax=Acanthosepion pharaonis TaxID=158019 RepID=A0A812DRE2_ACAPH|nr:unnamed protein product [Sepia pharaonis]